jgi:hypothetical protein
MMVVHGNTCKWITKGSQNSKHKKFAFAQQGDKLWNGEEIAQTGDNACYQQLISE